MATTTACACVVDIGRWGDRWVGGTGRKAILALALLAALLPACRGELREEKYPSGALKARGHVKQDAEKNFVLVGLWTYSYPNGQKEAEGEYRSAKESGARGDTGILKDGREGVWTFWYPGGQKSQEAIYKAGKAEGQMTFWYENGQKRGQENYKNGDREGPVTKWYENGRRKSEENYRADKKEGPSTFWYENGQKKIEETYKAGKREGPVTKWYENGQKNFEGIVKDGKREGLLTFWHENGQKSEESTYSADKKEGLSTFWYEDGQKMGEVLWKDGKASGVHWDRNGQKADVSFGDGEKEGNPAGQPVVIANNKTDALQFGKPTVKIGQLFGANRTRVMVQAKNMTNRQISCTATATFMTGDTILGLVRGLVADIPAGGTKTVEMDGSDDVKGYDTMRLATSACF